MSIKMVEFGPFGCRLERGGVDSVDDIPDGFRVVRIEAGKEVTVFVEPTG
ncbi:hypothetical protein JXL21_03195 [Candidatus Bathyarchaeota archaeon]|nr:hypothetical protein [Candidatus Bathyarchaeota archaeon]